MVQNRHGAISIHAPREGCDVQIGRRAQDDAKHFNPRTPRGVRPLIMDAFIANANFNPRTPRGVRRTTGVYLGIPQRFQSTHPARGATIGIPAGHNPLLYFNPRTPRGVRRFGCHITPLFYQFQSTHPARGATAMRALDELEVEISIHAPREGCDMRTFDPQVEANNFNPRTPRGVRHCIGDITAANALFQSTHPARGATTINFRVHIDTLDFNPRTPRGVRQQQEAN